MRAVLLVALAVLLAGCTDTAEEPDPAPEPGTDPAPAPAPAPGEPAEAIVEVLNATAQQGLPGGTSSLMFDVPAGYMELFITGTDGIVMRGDVALTLTDPEGTATELQSGVFVHDDAGQSPVPCSCEWRLDNPAAGTWTLSWTVQGEMTLPLRGLAQ